MYPVPELALGNDKIFEQDELFRAGASFAGTADAGGVSGDVESDIGVMCGQGKKLENSA